PGTAVLLIGGRGPLTACPLSSSTGAAVPGVDSGTPNVLRIVVDVDAPRPGGYIVEGANFLVEHAPLQESSDRTVIVESRRHVLDFGEMTAAELAEFGSTVHRLVPAVKAATGVQRVYLLAVMERAPHFHLWLVPKRDEGELRGVAYLAQQPPLTTLYSAAEAMSRKIREQ